MRSATLSLAAARDAGAPDERASCFGAAAGASRATDWDGAGLCGTSAGPEQSVGHDSPALTLVAAPLATRTSTTPSLTSSRVRAPAPHDSPCPITRRRKRVP